MGGNAFQNLELSRVPKELLLDLVLDVVERLNFPEFTFDYAKSSLMGSCGKKETTGDVDLSMNTYKARFCGESSHPVFNQNHFEKRLLQVLPRGQVSLTVKKMGGLLTAWDFGGSLYQVDFMFGKKDYMLFSHHSPGNESSFKGVHLTQSLGILAKMMRDYEEVDESQLDSKGEPMKVAKVGLHMNLEKGVYRQWELQKERFRGAEVVSPEEFETKKNLPRYSRLGYVDVPEDVLYLLLGKRVSFDEVDSFEKLAFFMRNNFPDEKRELFVERFTDNYERNKSVHNGYPLEDFLRYLV